MTLWGGSVGTRIRAIRAALTQAEFAQRLNVDRKTVVRWEADERMPDGASLLALWREFGADVHHVLTGESSANAPAAPSLAPDESKALTRFRALGAAQRTQSLAMLEVLALGGSTGGTTVIAKGKGTKAAGHAIYEAGAPRKRKD